jgi:dienelactone hydrolase
MSKEIGRRSCLFLALALLVVGCGDDDPFSYDSTAPLEVQDSTTIQEEPVKAIELTYASPKGGRVPALVVEPEGEGPFAGLILQHGLPGTSRDMFEYANEFARLGAVVVAIDAPFARRSGPPVRFDPRDRAEQVQLIIDLRRAVDLLRAREDVDDRRIGYLGISYGGAMGGLLAGLEDRIAAFVLAVGDGGLVEHFTEPGDTESGLTEVPRDQWRPWLEAMKPIEPLRHVGKATAPMLFQSARNDEAVPPRDARRFQEAGPETKEVRWYDSGHFLPAQAVCDQARWLAEHLATDSHHPACR